MKMFALRSAAFGLALAFATGNSQAAQIVQNASVTSQNTNYTAVPATPAFNQFNPALGTLTSIAYSINGAIAGFIRFESLDAGPATITSSLNATITLHLPGVTNLIVTPAQNFTDNVTAFDGVIDFGGTSGVSHNNLSGNGVASGSSSAAAVLAQYIGLGTFNATVDATGASTATGAGNLITQFSTQAGATVQLIYNYDVPTPPGVGTPEPATIVSLISLLPVVGFAVARRRKTA